MELAGDNENLSVLPEVKAKSNNPPNIPRRRRIKVGSRIEAAINLDDDDARRKTISLLVEPSAKTKTKPAPKTSAHGSNPRSKTRAVPDAVIVLDDEDEEEGSIEVQELSRKEWRQSVKKRR